MALPEIYLHRISWGASRRAPPTRLRSVLAFDGAEMAAQQQQSSPVPEAFSPWNLGGLSWRELVVRLWQALNDDDIFNRSAQLAYYFFLALFPALICLTSVMGLLAGSGSRLYDTLVSYLSTIMPRAVFELVARTLEHTIETSGGGKITFGFITALWSATAGMRALEDTLNAVYNVKESRPIWKVYGIAVAATIICGLLVLVALGVILCGDTVVNFAAPRAALGPIATWTWKIVQLAIAFSFVAVVFSFTYYFCPDIKRPRWRWITPGALVGITTWAVASIALRLYLHFSHSYTATYGSLGAVMVLLLWFYVTGMMLLLGAEVNAEVDAAVASRLLPQDNQEIGTVTGPRRGR
jgi:membrane protein